MDQSARCLLLCGTENVASECAAAIQRDGFVMEVLPVTGSEAFRQAIDSGDWDVVFADYLPPSTVLPPFAAEHVLSFIAESSISLPVIVITAPEQLQSALHLMDKGAVDCIRTDELFRLAPVVRREVACARRCHEMTRLQQRHDMLLNTAAEGFWDWNLATGEMFFSNRWLEILGYEEGNYKPTFTSWLEAIHPDDLGPYLGVWTDYMEGTIAQFCVEYRMRAKNGDYHWVSAQGVSVVHEGSEPVYLAGTLNDITDRKQVEWELQRHRERLEQSIAERTAELRSANEQLSRLARLDDLTEIPNRRCLDDTLARECSRVSRDGKPLTLLMIDIDHFKRVNDEFGHQVGDTCLKMVAATLRRSMLRPSDLVARYGGEEFVVLLPNTGSDGGRHVYERIRDALLTLNNMEITPTISVGLTTAEAGAPITPELLLASADKALYQAKGAGRNRLEECMVMAVSAA
ncbi:diguanylate cyclase [Beggiatoa alba]|nr:diguanylate cyclase [Beggiatoa alba]